MSRKKLIPALNKPSSFWRKNSGWIVVIGFISSLWGCGNSSTDKLPILGQREAVTKVVNGKEETDSVYQSIPDFKFVSQYGDTVTARTLDNKIYVADFFFTSCPTICPKMKVQLKRVYEKFKGNPDVMLLSHTIDPAHDSVAVLKEFAQNLGVTGRQWLFVTGDRDKIYDLGQSSYMVTAQADSTAPGGVIHSGAFILVDKEKHIRGIYDGTTEAGVDKLMTDMTRLLAEYKP
ncbi:SCO family protein [Spirosoma foliorum]|uniref:SCO family protein n=1 Tax=Spirosoma foliorum TaxID=2710596 RepID=A0A7G5H610_9BACT|nr:SCO family protein [Spirosoma foliorum]